jgi:thiosulfate/3-mercaptopyruvate sulfurtransferase
LALASIGHADHTSVLDGNLKSWKAAGYPVATGKSAVTAGRLTVKPAADVVVDGPWVRAHLDDPAIRLLDVREDEEWDKGMIPNARRFTWQDLFSDVDGGRFKTPAQMREVFARAGVGAGQTAVTYCAVGMRASVAYFAARAAGVRVRVYAGSMSDWKGRAGYPLSK